MDVGQRFLKDLRSDVIRRLSVLQAVQRVLVDARKIVIIQLGERAAISLCTDREGLFVMQAAYGLLPRFNLVQLGGNPSVVICSKGIVRSPSRAPIFAVS